ncbi:acetylcholine receptor subunit beta-like [Physella acuta]|uniref:acetylcholine receptor subunit beta-like n=1 Tax=Physella acuta TaxID=109671 RepID=UPI0027DB2FCC|nr:acetylcholine receptor subunit beta-like [Physella acuta]
MEFKLHRLDFPIGLLLIFLMLRIGVQCHKQRPVVENGSFQYDRYRKVRPAGSKLSVSTELEFENIVPTEGLLEKYTLTGFIKFQWTDKAFIWDPSINNDIDELELQKEKIWHPRLSSQNMDDFFQDDKSPVKLMETQCSTQELEFNSLNKFEKEPCKEDSPWEELTINVTASQVTINSKTFPDINMVLKLYRRVYYILLILIVPIIIFAIINILIHAIPPLIGERISFGNI